MLQRKDSSQKETTPIQILLIFDAAKITSHKMKKKKRTILLSILIGTFLLCVIAGGTIYYYLFAPQFHPSKTVYIYVDRDDTADSITNKIKKVRICQQTHRIPLDGQIQKSRTEYTHGTLCHPSERQCIPCIQPFFQRLPRADESHSRKCPYFRTTGTKYGQTVNDRFCRDCPPVV